jgi:hypothetical protein
MKNMNVLVFTPQSPVTTHGRSSHRTFSVAGAAVGTVVFLVIGLFPSLVYGGAATVHLASGLFGASGAPHVGFIVFGIVFAVTLVGALFAALGAVAGASVGALTRTYPVRR